jgi:uncharacterized membrane protein
MRIPTSLITAAMLLGGCEQRDDSAANLGPAEQPNAAAVAPAGGFRWDLRSSGEGVALALVGESGATAIRLFCPAGQNRLLVNVPSFKPIGSEERLSFGSGGEVVALVADPRGDAQRGGVSGTGPVPDDLKGLVAGPIGASYGAQHSGPHAAPPSELSRPFVTACFGHASAALKAASKRTPATSPCLVQDGKLLRLSPLKAVGTEPFWGARIEGRCVTYSHPDDQKGTRLWTRFTPGPDGGIWAGALGGHKFELRTRTAAGCSDGMSDKRYPIAVKLIVNDEQRSGCAEPL